MSKKTEIIVEQFAQGITVRWKDCDGEAMPTKALAIAGTEHGAIGKEVWRDILEVLCDSPTEKVRVKIECEAINQED